MILLSLLLFIRNSVVFAEGDTTENLHNTENTYNNIGNNVNNYPIYNNNIDKPVNNYPHMNNYPIYNNNNYPIYNNNVDKNVNNYHPIPQYKNENDISNNQNQQVIDINASYEHNNDNNKEDSCAPVAGVPGTQGQTEKTCSDEVWKSHERSKKYIPSLSPDLNESNSDIINDTHNYNMVNINSNDSSFNINSNDQVFIVQGYNEYGLQQHENQDNIMSNNDMITQYEQSDKNENCINSNEQSQNDIENKIYERLFKKDQLICFFITVFVSGLGGYNNTWKPICNSERWYVYRNELLKNIALGINYRICPQFNIPYVNHKIDIDLHIIGFNSLPMLATIGFTLMSLFKGTAELLKIAANCFQVFDLEIAVFKYWSISLNIGAMIFNYYILSWSNDI